MEKRLIEKSRNSWLYNKAGQWSKEDLKNAIRKCALMLDEEDIKFVFQKEIEQDKSK